MSAHETTIAIQVWADKYHSQIDRDLTMAWPLLKDKLEDLAEAMTTWELVRGPSVKFRDERLGPVIENWTKAHIAPILQDAQKDLRSLIDGLRAAPGLPQPNAEFNSQLDSALRVRDAAGPALLAGGLGTGVATLMIGIGKSTTFLLFSTMVVSWPLVIGGLVITAILIAIGTLLTQDVKRRIRVRFREQLLPRIETTIIGEDFEHEGKRVLSLRRQMKATVEEWKELALQVLKQEGL